MALGDGVASAEFRVKFDGNFVGGDFATALAHVRRSIEHNHPIVAPDFHAAAGGGDGQSATFFGSRQVYLHVVSEADDFLLRAVGHSVGVSGALRKAELHWRGGRGLAALAIEGEIARSDLQIFVGGLSRSGSGAGEINLDVAFADYVAGGGFVITFAGVNVVVAAAIVTVDRDPDVLEEGSILVFVLGGVRSADGEELPTLVCTDIGEFGGFLLHGLGNWGRRVLASARGLDGAAGVNAGNDERDESRGVCGPTCVARCILISQSKISVTRGIVI